MANGRVREYIGARYVPVFADPVTWDDERAYDPLTMVQYSGETYMSKQYVPIGAQLPTVSEGEEDNEFWVHMSNWNAQVEGYREEVLRYAADVLLFDGRIDTLEADLPTSEFNSTNTVKAAIDAINTAIGLIEDNIDSVESDIDNLKAIIPAASFSSANTVANEIDDAKARITNLESLGDVVILIGDSYGEGWDPDTSTSHDGWVSKLTARLQNIGKTVKSAAQGRYGFGVANTFLSLLQQVVGNMTANEKSRCTKVLIAGGFNDRNASQSSITDGINNVISYINANLPQATLYVSHVGYCVTNRTSGSHAGATASSCVTSYRRYEEACMQKGAKFDCGSITTLHENSWFTSDYVHPNSNGNSQIAKRLMNFLLDGTAMSDNVSLNNYFTETDSGWTINSSPNELLYFVDGNRGFASEFTIQGYLELVNATPQSVTLGLTQSIVIGQINAAGLSGANVYIPVFGVLHNSPTGYYDFTGRLGLNNAGRAALYITKINSTNTNYLTLDIDKIQIRTTNCLYL